MSYREGRAVSVCRIRKVKEMDQVHLQAKIKDDKAKKKEDQEEPKRYHLMSFWELPEYMKDNEFILHYYRAKWPLKQALFSVFRWHNETLNVWTHLVGFLLFLGLTLANLTHPDVVADLVDLLARSFASSGDKNVPLHHKDPFLGTTILIDLKHQSPLKMGPEASPSLDTVAAGAARWPFFVFLGGSMFCLLSSSICHLFSCHSHPLNLFLLRIDYVGITVMIITSFFPQIYYVFLCNPLWQCLYLATITAMGIFTVITLLSPILSTSKYRAFRAMLFCSMGLFGVIPAIHACFVNWGNPRRNVTLTYELSMALSYLMGTFFYVTRIPERWKPGWFDIAGHSHQIFHVLVVMGALAHYAATLVMLDWRDTFGCSSPVLH